MNKYKIVIVENDEDEQFFIKEAFQNVGLFDILAQVSSGNELFDWMQEHPGQRPDVILSDLNMPGKNGYDIIEEIKTTPDYASLPVIITSTSSAKLVIDKCMHLGAADYLVKPDTFIEYVPFARNLHAIIDRLMAKRDE
ncbi:MAG TPA: response regulator [Flavisolibacter sp.]|jgi:CheY-like chemotaxis protein|nr:response regulator [Flavisolibacter sp.]